MKRTHLAIQLAIVLTATAAVGWPQVRSVPRVQSVWQYAPNASRQTQADELSRTDRDPTREAIVGFGRASFRTTQPFGQPETVPGVAQGLARQYNTPIAVAAVGGKFNALVGIAQTSLNMPIPYARVVVRNIHSGRIEARATANDVGRFSFLDLDPSSYVVELLGPAGSVVAASEVVTLGRGDARQTTVRTIAAAPDVAATFGNRLTGTLEEATTVAASNGVTRTTSNLTPQESPNNPTGGGW